MRVIKGEGPTFEGTVTPTVLPRDRPTPAAIEVGFHAPRSQTPTRIAGISIGFSPSVAIDPEGLPTCEEGRIRSLSLDRARQVCGPALIGEGSFAARVSIPDMAVDCFGCVGETLAFNSIDNGRPAILLDLEIGSPIPDSFSIVLAAAEPLAGFPTAFAGTVPPFVSGYGYLQHLTLRLRRVFRVDGERRSYISAECPAPKGFRQVNFAFARLGYTPEGGPELGSRLVRRCSPRRLS